MKEWNRYHLEDLERGLEENAAGNIIIVWKEIKITPDKWKFEFSSVKTKSHDAPKGTGALDNIAIPYSVFLKMSLRS